MSSLMRLIAVLIAMAGIAGCVLGPDYERPAVETPQNWRLDGEKAKEWGNGRWWHQFNDPVLAGLIEEALSQNKDLLIATWRVEEFLGRYGVIRSDLFPQVFAEGAAARDYFSEDVRPVAPGIDNPDNIFQAFLTATWEIDFWGRLRRASEAARAELLSTEEARQAVVLTLMSSVAVGYIDLLSLDRQLQISIETAETRKKTLEIFIQRHRAGIVSNLELSQVKSQYQSARAAIP